MSNVWKSIASRAHGAAPTTRTKSLLKLFSGYARSQSTRSFAQWSTTANLCRSDHRKRVRLVSFSTSSCLKKIAKRHTSKPPPPQHRAEKAKIAQENNNDAKLGPAQTVASHTEGLSADGEGEQLTWRDYDPEGGMPLPGGERSQAQINAIFQGESVEVDTGNYILSVMHWRRMSGALIDVGLDFPSNSGVSTDQALIGLGYVRSIVPHVDEAANGQVWAEEEQQRLREHLQAKAVKLGLYKARESEETDPEPEPGSEPTPEESQQGTAEGRAKTGDSVLIQTRKANESAFEIWKAEKELKEAQMQRSAEAQARGPLDLAGGVLPIVHSVQVTTQVKGPLGLKFNLPRNVQIGPPQANASLAPVEEKPAWLKYYEEQAVIIKDNVIPQMSTFRRLAPSCLVLLIVLAGCYYLSENYTPPPKSARVWPGTPPAVATMYAITGVLLATFIMGRIPPLWRTYSKYMTVVPAYPYALSIVGAIFRHDKFAHLVSNVVSLWLFGLLLHDDVGRGTFLAICLGSGVFGSYSSLLYNVVLKQWRVFIFGASGSAIGVAFAACTLHPNSKLNLFGIEIPVAAWVFMALFGASEVLAAARQAKTTIDHAGHIGGMAMGVVAGAALRMRISQQGSDEMVLVNASEKLAEETGLEDGESFPAK